MLKWVGKKGEILERTYWIEKVGAVEKQVRFFLMVRKKVWCGGVALGGGGRDVESWGCPLLQAKVVASRG
jgi:hypothetical protein